MIGTRQGSTTAAVRALPSEPTATARLDGGTR